MIKLKDYFTDEDPDAYESDEEPEEVDTYSAAEEIEAPWREELMKRLKANQGITHLGLFQHAGVEDVRCLVDVLPGLKWIDVGSTKEGVTAPSSVWRVNFKCNLLLTRDNRVSGPLFYHYSNHSKRSTCEVQVSSLTPKHRITRKKWTQRR